jgi:hypothetical protein
LNVLRSTPFTITDDIHPGGLLKPYCESNEIVERCVDREIVRAFISLTEQVANDKRSWQ